MEGPVGRVLRVVLGIVLIYFGLARVGGSGVRLRGKRVRRVPAPMARG